MINNLTKECNFEISNLSIKRIYHTKLDLNSVIIFVRVTIIIHLQKKKWIFKTKAKLIYFSGDQQSIISFLGIKNLRSLTSE